MEVRLLRITDLSKKYGEHHALKHVSLHVNKGEIIGIAQTAVKDLLRRESR